MTVECPSGVCWSRWVPSLVGLSSAPKRSPAPRRRPRRPAETGPADQPEPVAGDRYAPDSGAADRGQRRHGDAGRGSRGHRSAAAHAAPLRIIVGSMYHPVLGHELLQHRCIRSNFAVRASRRPRRLRVRVRCGLRRYQLPGKRGQIRGFAVAAQAFEVAARPRAGDRGPGPWAESLGEGACDWCGGAIEDVSAPAKTLVRGRRDRPGEELSCHALHTRRFSIVEWIATQDLPEYFTKIEAYFFVGRQVGSFLYFVGEGPRFRFRQYNRNRLPV